jgi:hypothetical protein
MTLILDLRSDGGKAYKASDQIQINRLPNNRLKLTAHLAKILSARSLA